MEGDDEDSIDAGPVGRSPGQSLLGLIEWLLSAD
jgi:hypothetical protein